jgi:methyl acetate hydrolase
MHPTTLSAQALDRMLEDAIAQNVVPGVVAGVADRDATVYARCFGMRDTATRAPIDVNSVFGIASFTKVVSAAVVLQLVERRQIDLSTPVGDVLPSYDDLLLLEGFTGARPNLRRPRRRATVLNLLTHTSGLAFPTWSAKLCRYLEVCGIDVAELPGTRRVFEMPLVCEPDTQFNYGISGDWIGLLIEAVVGMPFEVALRQRVLEPLGMSDTVVLRSDEQMARVVSPHRRDGEGNWLPIHSSYYAPGVVVPEVYPAGGCLYSTALDFMKLQSMLLAGGTYRGCRLLQSETVDSFFRNHIGSLDIGRMTSEIPAASCDIPLDGWKWGMGMLVNEGDGPDGRSAGSGGWAGGWNTFFWIDRKRGLAAGLYTQTAPFWDPAVVDLYHRFEALVSA